MTNPAMFQTPVGAGGAPVQTGGPTASEAEIRAAGAMKIDINDDFQKEQIYQAASDFFTDQSIYLICNEAKATQTPMDVFEVNYSDVNVSKNTWTVGNVDTNYFNQFKEPPLFLETVMDVKSNIVYNHGMLALSMFIASEELLPK